MSKTAAFWSISLITLALSACTQEPAEIVYKGSEFFGREHEDIVNSANNETFDVDAPRYKRGYARPVEDAAVTTVGVSDLPPPAQPSRGIESHTLSSEKSEPANQSHVLSLNKHAETSKVEVQEESMAKMAPASKGSAQFIWPVDGGKVISHFDANAISGNSKGADGINIASPEGEPIFAAADGTVVYAGNELQGYGNMVILRHADGFMTAYAHARSLAVKKGEKVKQSALIGYVGSTGSVKTPQVYFAVRKGKTPVNPEEYLPHNG